MTNETLQPRFSTNKNWRKKPAAAVRVAEVKNLCRDRGVRFTHIRQQVLELLWESNQPSGAYELIASLERKKARPIAPPTVYRALDFLIEQGFACKIESRNAFVPCTHPESCNAHIFLICGDCKEWVELEDPRLEQQLADETTNAGFKPTRSVIEVLGTCATCMANGNSTRR